MSVDHRAVWERYVAAWKAESAEEKRALFEGCLAPDCVYTDPLVRAHGWQELLAYMLDFRKQIPGGHFVTREFMAHHERSLAQWQMLDAAAVAIGEGVSYAEYDERARLVVMTGFFASPGA